MSINLLETIQQNLHYQPLQKVDPNTQEVVVDDTTPNEERFSQATIPGAIIALYKFSTTENGAATLLQNDTKSDWPTIIFGETKMDFYEKICSYSNHPMNSCVTKTNEIFGAAVTAIKEKVAPDNNIEAVKELLADQRSLVLPYLPPGLMLGEALNDNTLDDRTNKMEGPVSNLMHTIGNIFSSSDEVKTPK